MGSFIQSFMTLVVISILIIVHEWGHFIAARKLGIHVEKFSIGFGKKIFSRVHNGTEYKLCLIPLGGYVKMAGDERGACEGKPTEFYSHPIGHRAIIIAMGSLINYVFAFLCFYFISATGFPVLAPVVGEVQEGKPAQIAGIQKDDVILEVSGQKVKSWKDLQTLVRSTEGNLTVMVSRDNKVNSINIRPEISEVPDIYNKKQQVRVIGIIPRGDFTLVRYGIFGSLLKAAKEVVMIPVMTFKVLYRVIVGAMPAKGAVGGPILIMVVIKQAFELGLAHVFYIMGVISASLAVINMFPLPVLDGGHLLFLAMEKIRGRPLSVNVEETLTKAGIAFFIMLGLFIIYNDISQLAIFQHIQSFFMKFK